MHLQTRPGVPDGERVVRLRQYVALVPENAHDRVINGRVPGSLPDTERGGVERPPEQTVDHGGVVHGDVEGYPGTGGRIRQPPRGETLRELHGMEDAHAQRLPHRAGGHQPADLPVGGGARQMVIDAEDNTGCSPTSP